MTPKKRNKSRSKKRRRSKKRDNGNDNSKIELKQEMLISTLKRIIRSVNVMEKKIIKYEKKSSKKHEEKKIPINKKLRSPGKSKIKFDLSMLTPNYNKLYDEKEMVQQTEENQYTNDYFQPNEMGGGIPSGFEPSSQPYYPPSPQPYYSPSPQPYYPPSSKETKAPNNSPQTNLKEVTTRLFDQITVTEVATPTSSVNQINPRSPSTEDQRRELPSPSPSPTTSSENRAMNNTTIKSSLVPRNLSTIYETNETNET